MVQQQPAAYSAGRHMTEETQRSTCKAHTLKLCNLWPVVQLTAGSVEKGKKMLTRPECRASVSTGHPVSSSYGRISHRQRKRGIVAARTQRSPDTQRKVLPNKCMSSSTWENSHEINLLYSVLVLGNGTILQYNFPGYKYLLYKFNIVFILMILQRIQ